MSCRVKTLQEVACDLAEVTARLVAAEAQVLALETADAGSAFGNATLVAGTIAVANTLVTADSIVVVGRKTIGGTVGNMSYTVSAGVGFTITSSNALDTSVVSYHIQY